MGWLQRAAVGVLFLIPSVARASDPDAQAVDLGAQEPEMVVLAETGSTYLTDRAHRNRAHNVAHAAALLDGVEIAPGAELSFNERVGDRTLENGFRRAPELTDGRLHQGVGGGVCQVATGLHIAALEAGLEIVEHRSHSVPLAYAPAGLDATVFFGRIDLRIRNPYDFRMVVRARAEEGTLTVRLEGERAVEAYSIESNIVREITPRTSTVVDPELAAGEEVVESEGRTGLVVTVRTFREGESHRRVVVYPASSPVVRVGPSA